MSTLLKETGPETISLGTGHLVVRPSTALEREIAAETAAGWAAAIIQGLAAQAEFGLPTASVPALAQRWVDGERDILSMASSLLTVALATHCVTELSGLSRPTADGDAVRPLHIDKADLAYLFRDDTLKDKVHDAMLRPYFQLVTVGNGSAPGSSTNSGADA